MCVCVQGHVFKGRRHHPASSACVALPAAARSIALLARFLAPVPSRGVLCSAVSARRGGVLTANASRGSDGMSGDLTMALLAAPDHWPRPYPLHLSHRPLLHVLV